MPQLPHENLPKIDFTTFILSVASAAFMGLGMVPPDPTSASDGTRNQPAVNLELARQNIDLLELIYEKTKGNRTAEEDRLMDQLLFELRMRFVEVQRARGGAIG